MSPLPAARAGGRGGVLLTALSAVFFGSLAIFGKAAERLHIPLSELLAIRFGVAAALLWAIAAGRRERLWWGRRNGVPLLMGVLYIAQAGAYFTSLRTVPAAVTSILLYLYPGLVMGLAALLLGEPAGARRWAAVGLALGGVFLVVDPLGIHGRLDGAGVGFGLLTAAIYATYILTGRALLGELPAVVATAYIATVAAGIAAAVSVLSGSWGPLAPESYVLAIGMALVATAIPASLFLAGLARVGATRAAVISTLEPVTTVVLAGLLLGERLGYQQLVGGAIVLAAAVVVARTGPVAETTPAIRE